MPCILVAADSREFAEMLRATLEGAGYEVVSAYSGLAAIAAVERGGVVGALLDVLMPGISGDAIAERLHQIDPALPVLLMTGDSGDAFAAGARLPVLHKPFSHEDLITAVHALVPKPTS